MDAQVTVFRSADETAGEDASKVQQMLAEQGIAAALLDDDAPGVPEGAYEVRVAPADQARAEELIANFSPDDELEPLDTSHGLDTVSIFHGQGTEMEALQVKSLLESNGISALLVGDSRYPNLPFQIRVAREHETAARRVIADAQAVGSTGAEEAEASGERPK